MVRYFKYHIYITPRSQPYTKRKSFPFPLINRRYTMILIFFVNERVKNSVLNLNNLLIWNFWTRSQWLGKYIGSPIFWCAYMSGQWPYMAYTKSKVSRVLENSWNPMIMILSWAFKREKSECPCLTNIAQKVSVFPTQWHEKQPNCCFGPVKFEFNMKALAPFVIQLFHHIFAARSFFWHLFIRACEPFLLTWTEKAIFTSIWC